MRLVHRVVDDVKEVVRFIVRDRELATALFQIALPPTLLLVLAEVGPSFLKQSLGIGEAEAKAS